MKTSICFVTDELPKHGAERFLYEILKAIDKDRFKCTVFTINSLDGENGYYLDKIEELGVKVVVWKKEPYRKVKLYPFRKFITSAAYRAPFLFKKNNIQTRLNNQLFELLKEFQTFVVLKWYIYKRYFAVFDQFDNTFVHLVGLVCQFKENPFKANPSKEVVFITFNETESKHVSSVNSDSESIKIKEFPLVIDTSPFSIVYAPQKNKVKIGIFSRIAEDQPTLFIFYLVHLLKCKGIDVELLFFGRQVDDKIFDLYQRTIKNLRIEEQVVFKGHTFNMAKSIAGNQLNFAIMNCGTDFIGYSSVELILYGLPVFFFNVDSVETKMDFAFNDLGKMAEFIALYAKDDRKLSAMGAKQRAMILDRYAVTRQIKKLEDIYAKSSS